jgi:hypothetical protein
VAEPCSGLFHRNPSYAKVNREAADKRIKDPYVCPCLLAECPGLYAINQNIQLLPLMQNLQSQRRNLTFQGFVLNARLLEAHN